MTISILPGNPAAANGSNDRTDTTFLDDNTAVPATAFFRGGRAFTSGGSAYVCLRPAGGLAPQGIFFHGGAAIRADGAQIILSPGVIARFLNGVGYTELGELCADTNAPQTIVNSIGVSSAGRASLTAVS